MFLLDDALVFSARDLTEAARCEFSLLSTLDTALGLRESTAPPSDPMLDRAARLGSVHEQRILDRYRDEFGDGVVQVPRPAHSADAYAAAARATIEAARSGADVIYQGTFFDGRFVGFCDFLVRRGDVYEVHDTKLARTAKVEALLQLAAYADALGRSGVPVASHVHLVLGDDTVSSHALADITPVYARHRRHLEVLLDGHRRANVPVVWGALGHTACGRCGTCEPEVSGNRDLLLVAGMRATQRARLLAGGVATVEDLVARDEPVPGLSARTYAGLRAQAAAQLEQERTGAPVVEVFAPQSLGLLPKPDAGDIFFDFEGDPLWNAGESTDWGLEYLFGVVEGPATDPVFRPFWAHDRVEERQALTEFLGYLTERRRRFPNMHVYHYAAYEKSALLRLAGRHGVGEEIVDDLLRAGVLVDLYPVVRASLRIGAPSYSIKKLEPLYMPEARGGDVTDAAASVVAYSDYCALRDAGDETGAAALLAGIASYNEDDCVSTLLLRDWLLARADEHGVATTDPVAVFEDDDVEPDHLESALLDFVGGVPRVERSDDQQAAALLAASLGYHRRERKPFWWAHFDRLTNPVDEWSDTRDTLVAGSVVVVDDWHKATARQRKLRRNLKMVGEFGTGSTVGAGTAVYLLYESPVPDGLPDTGPGTRGWNTGKVLSRTVDEHFRDVLLVEETLPSDSEEYAHVPMAVTPGPPVRTASLEAAVVEAAELVCGSLPVMPEVAAVDILRRVPPRTRSGVLPAVVDGDHASAITAALLDLDESYVAVQGPPGTGKTYTGARVVAELVLRHGWRVGVVAQSHSVVENMLDGILDAGVPEDLVAKAKARATEPRWTAVGDAKALAGFLGRTEAGCVVGGTAWDFTNANCVGAGDLDLLVIDEAGQFCLANTVAVARCARNLLLLGDPQQLPQVSQGTHPEPADTSALGWLAEGHGALPADRGYFLSRTWRMHPDLCARVSDLSYEGRLLSQERVTAARLLEGVAPGVATALVEHEGNSTESVEEAEEIVRCVTELLDTPWRDPNSFDGARPLGQRDVLVVAPFNAQVIAIRERLAEAGLDGVDVGTVDRFQGRQAAVAVVSMTASAHEDVPRGMAFLLSRNRLNVALSRGKWQAIVVHSPALPRFLPSTPDALADLGAFLRLTAT